MKIALAIVTLNAASTCNWEESLSAIDAQTLKPDLLLCADSESDDATVAHALAHGWQALRIERRTFNHGLTRDFLARTLAEQGFEILILMTQDVVLADASALESLIGTLRTTGATAAYGRQCSRNPLKTLDNWQREQCYPAESCLKRAADIPRLGLMTVFCSDAFCAWHLPSLLAQGGFPEAAFGEDTLAAHRALQAGSAIAYCAQARCFHDHSVTYRALFSRGKAVGQFHARHRELLRCYGGAGRKGLGFFRKGLPSLPILLQLFVKTLGYFHGRFLKGS